MKKKELESLIENIIHKVLNEGTFWPKSKLSNTFEQLLHNELRKKFNGIYYVDGFDLYKLDSTSSANEKKILTINPDKDSVDNIVKILIKKGYK